MHCEPAEPEGKGDMYWNIPLDVSTVNEIDQIKSYPDVTSDKQYHGSQFENDFPWLYVVLFTGLTWLDVQDLQCRSHSLKPAPPSQLQIGGAGGGGVQRFQNTG